LGVRVGLGVEDGLGVLVGLTVIVAVGTGVSVEVGWGVVVEQASETRINIKINEKIGVRVLRCICPP
jgi:hypothetical protein